MEPRFVQTYPGLFRPIDMSAVDAFVVKLALSQGVGPAPYRNPMSNTPIKIKSPLTAKPAPAVALPPIPPMPAPPPPLNVQVPKPVTSLTGDVSAPSTKL